MKARNSNRQRQPSTGEGLFSRIASNIRKRMQNRNDFPPSSHAQKKSASLFNSWWNRLISAVFSGRIAEETEQYAAHQATRDYVFNTLGLVAWGMLFPVMSVVATQFAGAEVAGMFSVAMVVGQLLLFVANYGVRTYQVSDVDEMSSFYDYQIQRVISCIAMLLLGCIYIRVRNYTQPMTSICFTVFLFRMIDGLADVYEGRLQQKDKLYLAGVSQMVRCLATMVVFSFVLVTSRNIVWACYGMTIAAAITFVVLTLPLTIFETENSYPWSWRCVKEIFIQCLPLFLGLFLYNVLEAMPKLVMEGALPYEDQLYFNAMFFPSQAILMLVGFVYKPQLVRLANIWEDPSQHKRFNIIIGAVMAFIVVVTALVMGIMAWIGIPALSFLYGLDFEQYRPLALVLTATGGLCAAIDFLYQIITVLREQQTTTKLYLIAIAFSIPISLLLVNFAQLAGAVVDFLVIMAILLVLLVMEYGAIRKRMNRW